MSANECIGAAKYTHESAVFPDGPIFSDFGPKSDLFGQKGPKMVWFYTQKSDFDKNEEK